MQPAFRGPLVSSDYAAQVLVPEARATANVAAAKARKRLVAWSRRAAAALGPASGVRAVMEVGAVPAFAALGFRVEWVRVALDERRAVGLLRGARAARVGCLVSPWGEDLDATWRAAVRSGVELDTPWCTCFNGLAIRLVDSRRSWARRFVEFNLAQCVADPDAFLVLWTVASPGAFGAPEASAHDAPRRQPSQIERVVEASARHTIRVCGSLQQGVRDAVTRLVQAWEASRGQTRRPLHEQAMTVVYRVLFLLYAEARGLVPMWHPVYRASYSVEALRESAESARRTRGLWDALQAMSRMAHAGCRVDTLNVPAFNGHLFAPDETPLAEHQRVDEDVARGVLLALTTATLRRGEGRRRIAFADLGVEELGAIYERLLDEIPSRASATTAGRAASARKSTGTFYTPRSITDYLVRRTLHPLVAGATPEAILSLRVVDPAMGSGAFLVAACRYLAAAYEAAVVRAGNARPGDLTEADRAGFRRLVAQRCLFGVDINPMAVQLARLSLWLTTLAADLPLTFLDHRLRVGDSLVGASAVDLARQPPGSHSSRARRASLPLFDAGDLSDLWRETVPARLEIASRPDDSLAAVRAKERMLNAVSAHGTRLAAWRRAADLWCACWFWSGPGTAPPPRAFPELCGALRGTASTLPARQQETWLAAAEVIADDARFFHWTLEFPEVFVEPGGGSRADGGFDAVLGNPPWDVVRADLGDSDARRAARATAIQLGRFVRESGIYAGAGDAHANRYHLFVERALALVRTGGRIGLVLPWGLFADHGSRTLRRHLLERHTTDAVVAFENRRAIFPIHRSVRFALVTATSGGATECLPCRLGETEPAVLDGLPDVGGGPAAFPQPLTRAFLRRISGEALAVPHACSALDVEVLDRVFAAAPAIASREGWDAAFGRELNATEDRRHFSVGASGIPVVEGKQISPFRVNLDAARYRLDPGEAGTLLRRAPGWERSRLAYRDVASPANRLTLIAAILPSKTVSTHTVFCLRTPLPEPAQQFLCGLFNSFVLNFVVRLQVSTHVTVALVERLPVPRPGPADPSFADISALAVRLGRKAAPGGADAARLQALVARLYGLDRRHFTHVLSTFPLVEQPARDAALLAFDTA